jgi:hypothetical protein
MPRTELPTDHKMQRRPCRAGRLWLAIAGVLLYGLFAAVSITWLNRGQIFAGHFAAMVGLPMAAGLAFIIVLLLPASYAHRVQGSGTDT